MVNTILKNYLYLYIKLKIVKDHYLNLAKILISNYYIKIIIATHGPTIQTKVLIRKVCLVWNFKSLDIMVPQIPKNQKKFGIMKMYGLLQMEKAHIIIMRI